MEKSTLAKRAYLLRLNSRTLAENMRGGSFKSLYHGQGIEFSGVREYFAGDDVRSIDWNVSSRMGKPYVKVFDEERELNVFLIIDTSLSMYTGSGKQSRMDTALDCASLITMACELNSSPVGAVMFDGKIYFSCEPKSGREQTMLLLTNFEKEVESHVVGSALDAAIQGAGRLLKKRSLVMIFSDFRSSGWVSPFGKLAAKHDVVAVRIADPLDAKIPQIGTVYFSDPETGYKSVFPTSSESFERSWRESNIQREENWKKECIRHGGIPLIVNTANDPAGELTRFFASRERW